jgi:hypothetical protein
LARVRQSEKAEQEGQQWAAQADIVIPASKETIVHGTHTKAAVWKKHLEFSMKETEG